MFAVPLVIFGFEHFSSSQESMRLVPSWMPRRLFWTYFAGAALIASGVSIVSGIKRRLAAILLGGRFFSSWR